MTPKQIRQWNQMRHTLLRISKQYMSSQKLRKESEGEYGLEFEEAIEMAYENVQSEAKAAVKGVKEIKLISETKPPTE
jgi:hypothetical protein